MKCENCCYYYQDEYDTYERCHFDESRDGVNGWDAPCEEDNEDYE